MAGRAVSDEERMQLVRNQITNVAEIVEAFIAMYEEGGMCVIRNFDEAVKQLTEARNCLKSAYLDTYRGDEPEASQEIDVRVIGREPLVHPDPHHPDNWIN